MKLTYYKIDSKGKTRQWSIWTEKINDGLVNIVTEDGIVGGKLKGSVTPITVGLGKNSIEEQAIFDAKSVARSKEKRGYGPDINNLKTKGQSATINDPMKGYVYKPYPIDEKEAKSSFTLDKAGIRGKLVSIENKLDGWRLRVRINRTECVFYTSSGDVTPNLPQIEKSLRQVFDKNVDYWEKKYGVTEHILDGEVYRHNLQLTKDAKDEIVGYYFQDNTSGFSATASAMGTVKNITPIKQELRDLMQFHLFDVAIDDKTVLDTTRQKIVKYYIDNVNVVAVEKKYIYANEEEIEDFMQEALNKGYEGLMIKILNTPYEFKKSKFMFKYKPLIDDEFQVVGFNESLTGNTLGSLVFAIGDKQFSGTPMMTDFEKKEIWDNQSKYLGKWATCIFLNYTDDNLPRHPRVKGWRKGKSQD